MGVGRVGLRGRLKVKDEELKKELKEKGLFCCVYRAAAKDFFFYPKNVS